jgi:CRP-like cAMP-binding protein
MVLVMRSADPMARLFPQAERDTPLFSPAKNNVKGLPTTNTTTSTVRGAFSIKTKSLGLEGWLNNSIWGKGFGGVQPHQILHGVLSELSAAEQIVPKGTELVSTHQKVATAYIILEGWAASYLLLGDGGRHILNFRLPSDVIGAKGLILGVSDRAVEAVTHLRVLAFDKRQMLEAFGRSSLFTQALLVRFARDEAIICKHLAAIGARGALERTAHLLLELGFRLRGSQPDAPRSYHCPLSQSHLADALGMTAIHLNRVLRQLRQEKLVVFSDGLVECLNLDALIRIAEFDDAYLG